MAKEFKSEIIKVFDSDSPKKIAIIKWGDNEPTIDIRRFSNDGIALKGVSLSVNEIDDVVVGLHVAKLHYEDLYSPKPIDRRETVDLMSKLNSAPDIVDTRTRGYVTHDNKVVFKLKPKFQKRIDRLNK
jgi:hypothetical protein